MRASNSPRTIDREHGSAREARAAGTIGTTRHQSIRNLTDNS